METQEDESVKEAHGKITSSQLDGSATQLSREAGKQQSTNPSQDLHLDPKLLQLRDIRTIFCLREVSYYLFGNEIAIPIPTYLRASLARLEPLRTPKGVDEHSSFVQLLVEQLLISAIFEEAWRAGMIPGTDAPCQGHSCGLQLLRGINLTIQVEYDDTTYLLTGSADTCVWYDSHDPLGFSIHLLIVCTSAYETMQNAISQLASCMAIANQRKLGQLAREQRSKEARHDLMDGSEERIKAPAVQSSASGQTPAPQRESKKASGSTPGSRGQTPDRSIHSQCVHSRFEDGDKPSVRLQRRSLATSNRTSVSNLREIFEHCNSPSAKKSRQQPEACQAHNLTVHPAPPSVSSLYNAAEVQPPVHGLVTDGRIYRFARIDRFGWWMLGRELDWEGSDSARINTLLRLLIREALGLVRKRH